MQLSTAHDVAMDFVSVVVLVSSRSNDASEADHCRWRSWGLCSI